MAVEDIKKEFKTECNKAIQKLKDDMGKVRTGRANASILDKVMVEYYGASTPLNQLAQVNTPEARLITVQPYDKSLTPEIEKAIMSSDLGLNPATEGNLIRLPIPPLTEERRKDLVKMVKKTAEEAKVSVRNHRRDANEALKKAQKSKEISEDESKKAMEEVQKMTDQSIKEIDDILESKEKDILTI